MAEHKQKIDWHELLEEQRNIKADGYVLYLRRSIKQRGKSGVDEEKPERIDSISIEQQREACEHIAKSRGLEIISTFEEQISAKVPSRRPEFQKMLEYLNNSSKKLGILSWSPDRLSRNALESGIMIQFFLDRKIIDFQFATYLFNQDDTGVEYLMMEFARAMGYSLRLRKNVLRGMYKKYFDEKEWTFPDKFGYERLKKSTDSGEVRRVNFPIPHEGKNGLMGEFEAMQLAFHLRLKGYSFDKIAKFINDKGFISKNGKRGKMTKAKLAGDRTRIGYLKDSFYYGLAVSKFGEMDLTENTVFDDDGKELMFTPAITKEEFSICQKINEKEANVKTKVHDYLPFRGFIRCGHCGELLVPQIKKKRYVYYYCYNKLCEGNKAHSQSNSKKVHSGTTGGDLFPQIEKILKKGFKVSKEEFTLYLVHLEKQNQLSKQLRSTDLKRIQANKGHIKSKMEEKDTELMKALGSISNDSKKVRERLIAQYEKDIENLQNRLQTELDKEAYITKANHAWTQNLKNWLEHMQKAHIYWQNATLAQKKVIAENVFLELVIKDGKLANYKYKEPYSTCEKVNLSYNGGDEGT